MRKIMKVHVFPFFIAVIIHSDPKFKQSLFDLLVLRLVRRADLLFTFLYLYIVHTHVHTLIYREIERERYREIDRYKEMKRQ